MPPPRRLLSPPRFAADSNGRGSRLRVGHLRRVDPDDPGCHEPGGCFSQIFNRTVAPGVKKPLLSRVRPSHRSTTSSMSSKPGPESGLSGSEPAGRPLPCDSATRFP